MGAKMTFGEYFRILRVRSEQTLREFCKKEGFDPGNISRIERGLYNAPLNEEKLQHYAKALRLAEGSDDWIEFFDLAAASRLRGEFHDLTDEEVLKRLPVLFRSLDNENMTAEKLDKIINLIRHA